MKEGIIEPKLVEFDVDEIFMKPNEVRTNILGHCKLKLVSGSFEMIPGGHADNELELKCVVSDGLLSSCGNDIFIRNFSFSITAGPKGCTINLVREHSRKKF